MKNQILKRVLILSLVLALAPVFSLGAKDFGILLDQSVSFDDSLDFKYSATLIPWFSTPMGKRSDFFISAGVSAGYEFNEWKIIPELLRTEFLFNMAESGELKIGRFFYSDPLGFVASGLFDGVYYSVDIGEVSTIGTGLWYTGFLYKKNANIAMTQDEANTYAEPVDYSDFYRTYFAPGRLVFAFDWQHPGIKELIRFDLALVAQIDLFGGASGYHSQYLIGKAVLPVKNFVFDIGICAELAENSGQAELSFAGELEIDWYLPTKIYDRLSFLGRFSTGVLNSIMRSFEPITTVSHGGILKAKLAGISMLRLEYTARPHESFSFGLQSSYFILSDLGTYEGLPAGPYNGHFLGNEFYGFLVWGPISDIQIRAGGGAFLPVLGNANRNAATLWRADLSILLSLF